MLSHSQPVREQQADDDIRPIRIQGKSHEFGVGPKWPFGPHILFTYKSSIVGNSSTGAPAAAGEHAPRPPRVVRRGGSCAEDGAAARYGSASASTSQLSGASHVGIPNLQKRGNSQ